VFCSVRSGVPPAEVEEVRRQAEHTIVLASVRVGEELAAQPVAKGSRGQLAGSIDGSGSGSIVRAPLEDAPSLAEQVGSQEPRPPD
jgi:hypothetical protein